MKKLILLFVITFTGNLISQNYTIKGSFAAGKFSVIKNSSKVFIQDSAIQVTLHDEVNKYKITKKIDDKYLLATDGKRDFKFKITLMNKVINSGDFKFDSMIYVELKEGNYTYYTILQP